MNRLRTLVVGACTCAYLFCLSTVGHAAKPFEIKTNQGTYKVVELPDMPAAFELTADLAWAVTKIGEDFHVISTESGEMIGRPRTSRQDQWKVIGQELVVCEQEGWVHYTLPDFVAKQTYPYPPPVTGTAMNDGADYRLAMARGWYCRGFIYEDDHNQIVATIRSPNLCCRINMAYARTSTESTIPVSLGFGEPGLEMSGYDVLLLRPIDDPKYRAGMKWFTAAGKLRARNGQVNRPEKRMGYYVEFVGPHFENLQLAKQYHWWGSIPMVLDANTDPSQWTMKYLASGLPANVQMSVDPSGDVSEHELIRELYRVPLSEAENVILNYAKQATPDFELVAGRPPKDIPLGLVVTFKGDSLSQQVVWTEITKDQIMARFGAEMLKRQAHENLRLAELRNENMLRQHRESERQIQQSNANFKKQPPRFVANFQTYAGYAGFICTFLILATLCAVLLYRLNRQFRASLAEAEDDDWILVPIDPPVLN